MKWLAQRMRESGSSMFLVEWMQPAWLTRGQLLVYYLLISSALALFLGGSLGVYWSSAAQISADTAVAIEHGLWWWPTVLCFVWFLIACGIDQYLPNQAARGNWNRWRHLAQGSAKALVYFGLWLVLMGVPWLLAPTAFQTQWMALVLTGTVASFLLATAGWQHRTMQEIQPAEAMSFSWRRALTAAPLGSVAGVLLWLLFRAVWTEEPQIRFVFSDSEHSQGFLYVLVSLISIGSISGGILGGFKRTTLKVRSRSRPNQGIANSRRNALLVGAGSGMVMTVAVFGLMLLQDLSGTQRTVTQLALFSMGIGWSVVACAGAIFGGFDVLKHYAMRAMLKATRSVPSPLERFLSYACELNFLKPVGGSYMFWHRLLLEHFADRKSSDRDTKAAVVNNDIASASESQPM
ncbi:MAG: hypothetical protein Q8M16_15100 [Pirellulaceae bacterium]|nr:hypothetical protein [Pirellulaceae bacterium]